MFNEILVALVMTVANPLGEPSYFVLDYPLTPTDCAVRLAHELEQLPYNPNIKIDCE